MDDPAPTIELREGLKLRLRGAPGPCTQIKTLNAEPCIVTARVRGWCNNGDRTTVFLEFANRAYHTHNKEFRELDLKAMNRCLVGAA